MSAEPSNINVDEYSDYVDGTGLDSIEEIKAALLAEQEARLKDAVALTLQSTGTIASNAINGNNTIRASFTSGINVSSSDHSGISSSDYSVNGGYTFDHGTNTIYHFQSPQMTVMFPDGTRVSFRSDLPPCYCHAPSTNAYQTCSVIEHRTKPPVPVEVERVTIGDKVVILMSYGNLVHQDAPVDS